MRIAQIAPLTEAVPPRLYGGTERIVAYLAEELVRAGHEVTLFASGDSHTSAELIACTPRALRLEGDVSSHIPYTLLMLEQVRRHAAEFDVLHFHIDLLHASLCRELPGRALTTLHGRLDLPELVPFYREFGELPLVSISRHQRRPMPPVNWVGTVHHGLPKQLLRFSPRAGAGYLAFLGRICPEKRPDRAVEIACLAGLPLKIAAKVDAADRAYFEARIRPLLCHPLVEFIGEIGEADKGEFLGNARALLFPIDWPEPFGLVMIEAMACGTPVIAFDHGSVSEVIEEGVTGFVVDSVEAAAAAVSRLDELDRARVRQRFEQRFCAHRMAAEYIGIYRALARSRDPRIAAELASAKGRAGSLRAAS